MEINFSKTVAMTFTNKKQPCHFTYGYAGQQLTNVDEFKYLGVTFTQTLKWSKHSDLICVKALRKLAYLKRTLKNSTPCKITAYKTLIRPVRFSCMVALL